MDWSKGYTAAYYMTAIDQATWRDLERVEIVGGSIKRESTGLRESASVDCVDYSQGVERWIRIWMDAKQGGDTVHVPLFTGLATSPESTYNGARKSSSVDCYSVLKAVDDVGLLRGWYAPVGMSGAEIVRQLLAVGPAPVEIPDDTSPQLERYIVAEKSETHLTMADKVLEAINWRLRISGDGVIQIVPKSNQPVATFSPLDNDMLETEIKVSNDLFECPNVFVAIDDDMTGFYRDDSEDSPMSTVNRGREVWMQEDGCHLADNETIAQYAVRRWREAQKIRSTASYTRRFLPDVYPLDVVSLYYPSQELNGDYTIDSQDIDLTYNAQTSEEVMEGTE